ncbi:hypothetical protein G7Y89_g1896 [Cudoniella acicularis]|uniref:Uncharacterized protein n=1 Tax=Cudoniella acicularis TaxID=354080 RepID=A0A8H4RW40_9HELO|nr:hypothetical protein G7Y89_g1896 [Cudoniella acicularis]
MYSQAVLFSVLVAIAEARFGQEQVPIAAIQDAPGGSSGQAATLAGSSISTLLAAANPCDKLKQADLIVATLGSGAIPAAIGLVAAEQNFNPFVVSIPTICSDPTLPTTEALRGIVPLVDPSVGGSALENSNSATSKTTPFNAAGLSVAQVMAAQGFSNFTTKDAAGNVGAAGAASGSASVAVSAAPVSSAAPIVNCGGPSTLLTVTKSKPAATATAAAAVVASSVSSAASAGSTSAVGAGASSSSTAGVNPGFQASSISGLDFGLCTPTMKFEPGLDGRSDTEFTFQAIDPLVNKGQEEALNPNIITNRICDQLTNVCNANAAAKTACTAAKAQISALATKDASTANAWNTALGFAGTNINPDNAPQAGLIGHD